MLANEQIELGFSEGRWVALKSKGVPGNMVAPVEHAEAVDFMIDDVWMIEEHGARYSKHNVVIDEEEDSVTLELVFLVGPRPHLSYIPTRWQSRTPNAKKPGHGWEFRFTSRYKLFAGQGRVERSAKVERLRSGNIITPSSRRCGGFVFSVPGAVVGPPEDCTFEIPCPLYTYRYFKPGSKYTEISSRYMSLFTAPDRLPGIVAFENKKLPATFATWMDTRGELSYYSYLSGDGERISVIFYDTRSLRLDDNDFHESDVQAIVVMPTFRDTQNEYRKMLSEWAPTSTKSPSWVREMIVLEIMPRYYKGGYKGLTERLPFYRGIGFNAIYTLPHFLGGYTNVDPREMDPKHGTPEDLKEMIRVAHELGMHVIFDMVVHGFHEDSPIVKEHPEFFFRDEHGHLAKHHTWPTFDTDPANPAFQKFMVDLVKNDVRTYGIDGYRVDANSFKGPNWAANLPYPAWKSQNIIALYDAMHEAMLEEKKDIVMYSEMYGQVYHAVSNLVQDANWGVVTQVLQKMEAGEITAGDYKAGIARQLDTLLPGINRIRFCRNHDTSWYWGSFYGYHRRMLNVDTIHSVVGVPLVFAGDPDNGPNPDDDSATWEFYRSIFGLRKEFPELGKGEILLHEVSCDHPNVFSVIRRVDKGAVLALVSLSEKPANVTIRISDVADLRDKITLLDPIDDRNAEMDLDAGSFGIELEPFGIRVA
ncbi:MAG: alpha-amylase family glycosyl hydrolase, partial [Opitutales bacterium]